MDGAPWPCSKGAPVVPSRTGLGEDFWGQQLRLQTPSWRSSYLWLYFFNNRIVECFLWIFSIFYHQIPWAGGLLWELHWQWLWRLRNGDSHPSPHLVTILPSYYLVPKFVQYLSYMTDQSSFALDPVRTVPGEADWKRWSGGNRGSWNRSTELLTWKVHILYIHAWVYLHTFILCKLAVCAFSKRREPPGCTSSTVTCLRTMRSWNRTLSSASGSHTFYFSSQKVLTIPKIQKKWWL